MNGIKMTELAKRMNTLKPSATFALNATAHNLKQSGVDVINLTLGEPDFAVPNWVQDAVIQGMKDGFTKYTAVDGLPPLKKAIQAKFQRDYGLEYAMQMITVGAGTKQIIFNVMLATLNAGDEVIIPVPYWVSYPDITRFCQGVPVFAETSAFNQFKITPDELRFRINDRTKWLILNSPNNPSGAVYTADELRALSEVLIKFPHVNILCDDIYELMTYDAATFHSLVKIEPRLYHRTLICNGVSKSHAMTGFRLGYAAGPQDLIHAINLIQSQSTSNVCSLSQVAAIAALEHDLDFFKEWKQTYDERRLAVMDGLEHIDGLTFIRPQGAFYVYIGCLALMHSTTPKGVKISSDVDLCTYLLEEAHVALIPGSAFGLSPYLRMSYTVCKDTLVEGCKRIKTAVEQLKLNH